MPSTLSSYSNLPTSSLAFLLGCPSLLVLLTPASYCLLVTRVSQFLSGPVRRGSSIFAIAAGADYDYDYGDPSAEFEFHPAAEAPNTAQSRSGAFDDGNSLPAAQHGPVLPQHASNAAAPTLPLCCPEGQVYNYVRCTAPIPGSSWRPELDAAPAAVFRHSAGFPRCPGRNRQPAQVYQTEVFFHNRSLYLPHFVQTGLVDPQNYCIVKVEESSSPSSAPCPRFTTKVFACTDDPQALDPAAWTLVGFSHLLLVLAIAAYIIVPDLRSLQGQYLLCLLITLLLYNLLLFPTSAITFPASLVSCMALKAIKYFFFCGFFLWFNTICFDVWRTVRSGQDISGRRRFLAYSCYAWVLSAVLATAVLVLDITNGKAMQASETEPGAPLPECQLGLRPHVVLQLLQGLSVLADAVMLALAVSGLCNYSKLVCRLPRSDAVASVKQIVKLFAVMVCHSILSVSPKFLNITVITLWQFVVLETVAMVGILVYRRSVLKQLYRRGVCCRNQRSSGKRRYGNSAASAATGTTTGGGSSGGADSSVASMNGGSHNLNQQEQQFIVPESYPFPEKVRLSSV